jgi:hypothetical protein
VVSRGDVPAIRRRDHVISAVLTIDLQRLGARWAADLVVDAYVIDLAGRLADGLEPLRWISAFRYYGAPMRDGIDVVPLAGLTVAGLVLVAAGAVLFDRRDLRH